MKKLLLILFINCHLLLCANAIGVGGSGIFQYSVELTDYISPETGKAPVAYLWIPDDCKTVKAVMLSQQNMTEEQVMKNPDFQKEMKRLGVAMIWVAPAFSNNWDPSTGCQTIYENLMIGLAGQSGHQELTTVPVIPFGHSAQATFPWNFAAWNLQRTLCIISYHGDAPRTNLCGYGTANVEWGRTRNIDGIPGLMVEGEYEWWEARVRPALAFRMMYPKSCISFLCDTGHGHFDCCNETAMYLAKFIEKSMQQRLQADGTLKMLDPKDGYLFSRFHSDMIGTDGDDKGVMPEPFAEYNKPMPYREQTDKENCFWYMDKEMADIAYKRYSETHGKLPVVFTDKPQESWSDDGTVLIITLPAMPADYKGRLHSDVICGALKKINDTTFKVYDYEAGWDNPKRSYSAWIAITADADKKYKGGVLQVNIKIKK